MIHRYPCLLFALVLALTIPPGLLAQGVCHPDMDGTIAEVYYEPNAVYWQPLAEYDQVILRVDTPCDTIEKIFERGEQPFFDLKEVLGLVDGGYSWELRVVPAVDPEVREALRAVRETGDYSIMRKLQDEGRLPTGPFVEGEAFSVVEGRIIPPDEVGEKSSVAPRASGQVGGASAASSGALQGVGSAPSEGNRLATKDVLHYDDVIVTGSLCVGFDCANGESFGYDTIKLKENNLRIGFNDTSTGSFPTGNWQIRANDSSSGGASYMAIVDMGADGASTGGDRVFAVEAGAPANSLYVDDYGRVGFGTSIPYVELHTVDGDTPTVRLQQDGSSGFAAQSWDVAGNETNFFIRDVTHGSTLPFRMQPGAPSSSLTVRSTGNVGVGTWSPSDELHVEVTGSNGGVSIVSSTNLPQLTLDNTAVSSDDGTWRFRVNSVGNFVFTHADTNSTSPFVAEPEADTNLLVLSGDAVEITGRVRVNGTQVHPDYVFEPEYELESIEDHAEYMWSNRHLPAIGAGTYRDDGRATVDLVGHQLGIVEELEKAHIYIEQVHQELQQKTEEIARLEERTMQTSKLLEQKDAQIEELRVRLEALERQ